MHLRLLLWKDRKNGEDVPAAQSPGMEEAVAAERSAKNNLEETKLRGFEVNRIVHRLREFQETNHIGERVVIALQEGYGRHGDTGRKR